MARYTNPEHAIVEPISNAELLEGLAQMRVEREKKREMDGAGGPRTPNTPSFGFDQRAARDNGYGPRQSKPASGGWEAEGESKGDDAWGSSGGGGLDGWVRLSLTRRSSADEKGGGVATDSRPPRSGGNDCFNCGQPGHRSAECSEERKPRGGGGGCFKCGEEGHFVSSCMASFGSELTQQSRECPNGPSAGGRACYNCGQPGHEVSFGHQPFLTH